MVNLSRVPAALINEWKTEGTLKWNESYAYLKDSVMYDVEIYLNEKKRSLINHGS